ncbi:MAG: protein kinase [Candidatus Brocadiae bacterium]|nr:protein kinase [Candidatus Brocadiia bacterium]
MDKKNNKDDLDLFSESFGLLQNIGKKSGIINAETRIGKEKENVELFSENIDFLEVSISKFDIADLQTHLINRPEIVLDKTQKNFPKTQIRDNIFQRLLVSSSIFNAEQVQKLEKIYIKIKEEGLFFTFVDMLIQLKFLPECTVNNILHFKSPDGKALIPGYTILEFIGEGGMAAVYRGIREDNPENQIALKVFLPVNNSQSEIVRFKQECEVIKSLSHPNIVQAFEYGELYGMYYVVLEYIEGGSLADRITKTGAIPEEESLAIFEKLLEGMIYAWEKGFIHRDMKPANIMIGKDGIVKICDFGLAKEIDSEMHLTKTGTFLGTPHYMSPEQFASSNVDYRSDVYSLGITFYVMLTSRLPFNGSSFYNLCSSHINDAPPLPEDFGIQISRQTLSFLFQMIAKDPNERCSSYSMLWENFQKIKKRKMPSGKIPYIISPLEKKSSLSHLKKIIASFLALSLVSMLLYFFKPEEKIQPKTQHPVIEKKEEIQNTKPVIVEKKHNDISEVIKKEKIEQEEKIRKEKKIHLYLANIEKILSNLDLSNAQNEIVRLEVEYPKEQKILLMKEWVNALMGFEQAISSGNFTQSTETLKKFIVQQEKASILCKLLKNHLEKSELDKQVQIILTILKLDKSIQKLFQDMLIDKDSSWVKSIYLQMPSPESEKFLAFMENNFEKISNKFFISLQVLRKTLKILNAKEDISLENIGFLCDQEFSLLEEGFSSLDLEGKKRFLKNLLPIAPKIHPLHGEKVFALIKKENSQEIHKIFISFLVKSEKDFSDKILEKMMEEAKNLEIKMLLLTSYAKRNYKKGLINALKDTHWEIRLKALHFILDITPEEKEHFLLSLSSDHHPDIRKDVLTKLGKCKSLESIAVLQKSLVDDDSEIGKIAAKSLSEINTPESLQALILGIEKINHVIVGEAIVQSIADAKNEVAWNALFHILISHVDYRSQAMNILTEIGKPIIPLLAAKVKKSSDRQEQKYLLEILQNIGNDSVLMLSTLLENTPDIYLKRQIIKTLGYIGSPEAIPVLSKMLLDNITKRYAKQSLKDIGDKLSPDDIRYKQIRNLLQNY